MCRLVVVLGLLMLSVARNVGFVYEDGSELR